MSIQLCGTTPCVVCGAQDIKNTIMEVRHSCFLLLLLYSEITAVEM
jgi:hypothetical protein